MKKITVFYIAISTCIFGFSQGEQMQNKNGVDILPVKGEFALGIDAAPFLQYAGDIFGRTGTNTALSGNKFLSDYFNSNTIYGKYMLTDNSAARANFRLTDQKYTYKYNVYNDAANSPDSMVKDILIEEYSEFNIGLGYEFRRGKTRLKGIYGGELVFMRMQSKSRYEYGNPFTSSNMTPTSMFNANGGFQGGNGNNVAERITADIESRFLGLGLRAFVGVEYFFTPKICIGTEFGQALYYTANKDSRIESQYFDPHATDADGNVGAVRTNQTITAGERYFGFDVDNFNGSLYLMFYF